MASELSANNPDLIDSIRRSMGNQQQSDDNNSGEGNTSSGSSSISSRMFKK